MHASYAPASSLHSNVEPLRLELNWKDALLDATVPVGPSVIEVSGGTGGV